jgi:hypothetical protein
MITFTFTLTTLNEAKIRRTFDDLRAIFNVQAFPLSDFVVLLQGPRYFGAEWSFTRHRPAFNHMCAKSLGTGLFTWPSPKACKFVGSWRLLSRSITLYYGLSYNLIHVTLAKHALVDTPRLRLYTLLPIPSFLRSSPHPVLASRLHVNSQIFPS